MLKNIPYTSELMLLLLCDGMFKSKKTLDGIVCQFYAEKETRAERSNFKLSIPQSPGQQLVELCLILSNLAPVQLPGSAELSFCGSGGICFSYFYSWALISRYKLCEGKSLNS